MKKHRLLFTALLFTIKVLSQPINDNPCGAILITPITSNCDYQAYSNTGATATSGVPAPTACTGGASPSGNYVGGDIWLRIEVPSNGQVVISGNPVSGGTLSNTAMALYGSSDNTCTGTFTQIACNQDFTSRNLLGFINRTGLTPGNILFLRVWDELNDQTGSIQICVSTPTNDNCANSLFICDLNGYSGVTSAAYTADRPGNMCDHDNGTTPCTLWPDNTSLPGTQGHSTIDNNSWITFIASSTQANLNISVSNCWRQSNAPYNGIQMRAYKATNCANFVAVSPLIDGINNTRTFNVGGNGYPNLIPGQLYYLMVDGFAGDVCSYTITANSGVLVSGIDVAPSQTICQGSSATLTAQVPSNTGGQTFSWSASPTTPINNPTSASISVTPQQTTVFTCITTGICGANQSLNTTITVTPPPTATMSDTVYICQTESAILNPTNLNGIVNAQWIGGNGTFTPNRNTLNATYTPSASEIVSGIVPLQLQLNGAPSCGSATVRTVVKITTTPQTIVTDTIKICQGDVAQLNPRNRQGTTTLGWSGGNGVYTPNSMNLKPTYRPSVQEIQTGQVTLNIRLVGSSNCASTNMKNVVIINPTPNISIITNTLVTCNLTDIPLTTNTGTTINGTWTSSGTGAFTPNNTSTSVVYKPTNQDVINGTVSIYYTQNNSNNTNCVPSKDTVTIRISTLPVITISNVSTQPFCSDGSLALSAALSGGISTGTWSTSGTGSFEPNATSLNTSYEPSMQDSVNGNVTFTFTSNRPIGACPSTDTTFTVQVLPSAYLSLSNNITSVCSGTNISLAAVVGGTATTTTWTTQGSGVFNNTNGLSVIYTPSQSDIDNRQIVLTATTNNPSGPCEAKTESITIIIKASPEKPVINADPGLILCEKQATKLTIFSPGNASYQWLDNEQNLVSTTNFYNTPELSQNTSYFVRATLDGCVGDLTKVDITVNKRPTLPYLDSLKYLICDGFSQTIAPYIITPNSIIKWYNAPSNGTLVGTGTPYNTGILNTSTNYWIEAVSEKGCSSFDRLKVEVEVAPNPDITVTTSPSPAEITFGQILQVNVTPTNYAIYNFYVDNSLKQSSSKPQYTTNSIANKQTLKVEAVSDKGCSSLNSLDAENDKIVVIVHPFPNAFTPNGNGTNETYLKGFDLTIVNRWGIKMYSGLDGWNGQYNDKDVSPGTYYYIVNLVDVDGSTKIINGPVTLLK